MTSTMTVRAKLILLLVIAILALALIGGASWNGMRKITRAADEIGRVRLPSVQGLLMVNEAQTAIRSANRWALTWENNYTAQGNFSEVLKRKREAWSNVDRGWKIYEPLPQTPEEEKLWKQFVNEWDAWKAGDQAITATIEGLIANTTEAGQKALFARIYKQLDENAPRFKAAEDLLNKLSDLNVQYGKDAVNAGDDAASQANTVVIIVGLMATLFLLLLGIFIIRSVLKQLGGDPAYVSGVLTEVANGNLAVRIDASTGDTTSMLAAIQTMVGKLHTIIGEVRTAADHLSNASGQVSATAQSLSQSSSEQAASVEETTASMEQMSA
ncbi:methyl-accepting chemotaxis protein, partial [Candidatus Accumulibacter vicinus]